MLTVNMLPSHQDQSTHLMRPLGGLSLWQQQSAKSFCYSVDRSTATCVGPWHHSAAGACAVTASIDVFQTKETNRRYRRSVTVFKHIIALWLQRWRGCLVVHGEISHQLFNGLPWNVAPTFTVPNRCIWWLWIFHLVPPWGKNLHLSIAKCYQACTYVSKC